jgi:hypothetical protein
MGVKEALLRRLKISQINDKKGPVSERNTADRRKSEGAGTTKK